ncbi:MAG: hypothetical protein KF900_01915 [Bacteroidetes bacterium]|nr:hypothetical protein [Bacteroidota bacterium]
MKEDVLEQIIEDWLLSQSGTFTKHNVKYRPSKTELDYNSKADSSHSDIDVLAVHLNESGKKRVSVVSCKSWQQGFNPMSWHDALINNPSDKKFANKKVWKSFRELVIPKWSNAFREKIYEETQSYDFTYYIAIAKLSGGKEAEVYKSVFETEKSFLSLLKKNTNSKVEIKIITVNELLDEFFNKPNSTTLEATLVGRFMQVLKASNFFNQTKSITSKKP